jgi:hypothetical protein
MLHAIPGKKHFSPGDREILPKGIFGASLARQSVKTEEQVMVDWAAYIFHRLSHRTPSSHKKEPGRDIQYRHHIVPHQFIPLVYRTSIALEEREVLSVHKV